MLKPYIVSGDIYLLLKKWADTNGFVLPALDFFNGLRYEFSTYFRKIFSDFEFIHEEELVSGVKEMVDKCGLTPVTFDRAYYHSDSALEICRSVDINGEDKGSRNRPGFPTLLNQFQELRRLKKHGINEVVLVDDVVFSGSLTSRIISILSHMGIKVPFVCAGVGIGEGVNKLKESGCKVFCVRDYDDVIDEVCERDFFPGVPLSGRRIVGNGNFGAPYILPFGRPQQWASIPQEHEKEFSLFCIHQTICLFEEIEKSSNRIVRCSDLERKVFSLPVDDTRYINALQKILHKPPFW